MSILIVVLRAIHILGGVFWAGAAMVLYGFVVPSANATRPESGRFMQHLAGQSGLTLWMTIASWATIIAGVGLYGPATGQLSAEVLRSPFGIAISLGALLAIATFLEGQLVVAPTARKMAAIGRGIMESGKPPTPEQVGQLQAVQGKLQRAGTRGAVLLTVAVLCMAVARYL